MFLLLCTGHGFSIWAVLVDFLRFHVVRSCVESQRKKLTVLYSLKNNQDGDFLAEFSSVARGVLYPRKELAHRHGHLSVLDERLAAAEVTTDPVQGVSDDVKQCSLQVLSVVV